MGKSLVIHHKRDGITVLSGGADDGEQIFPGKTIARELAAGRATVTLTLTTTDPPTAYELVGFQPAGDGKVNMRVWRCRRIEQEG